MKAEKLKVTFDGHIPSFWQIIKNPILKYLYFYKINYMFAILKKQKKTKSLFSIENLSKCHTLNMYYLINRLKESPDILEVSLLLKTTTSYGPLLFMP